MQALKNLSQLDSYLNTHECKGCLADTNFLYGLAYQDDRLHEVANAVFDQLVDRNIGLFVNVVGRMEFIDLVFRKQITQGAIELFKELSPETPSKNLFNLLKRIRDDDTSAKRNKQSHKVSEKQLKKLRFELEGATNAFNWKQFCPTYLGENFQNEWAILEEDLGLNFVEILEDQTNSFFEKPLIWSDMVETMALQGLRGPDAMILNFFSASNIPLFITGDSDFANSLPDSLEYSTVKATYFLQADNKGTI